MSSPASPRSHPAFPARAPRRPPSHKTTASTPTASPLLPSPMHASTSYLPLALPTGPPVPPDGATAAPPGRGTPRRPRNISGGSSPSPSLRTPRLAKPRIVQERPNSAIYTSFPSVPPLSEADEGERSSWGKWLWWRQMGKREDVVWREVGKGMPRDLERGAARDQGERGALLGVRRDSGAMEEREGLPQLSRECLIAEIKCYGFYMLPPIIVFIGLVLGLGLWLHNRAKAGVP